ncbi:RNA polymerase sigma factor [Cohnella yongneupensis]|uniref:RNA polymerase sigma factor n=1 Tax=Cohnella yongneupensis TaxID=425006 RepID=A0ABW0R585_9BACL
MDSLKPHRDSGHLEDLLGRIRDGSVQAFDGFYEHAAPFIFGLSRKMLGDRMEAEDVCHDVLLAVITDLDRYDPARGSVEAWLAVLTKSKCIDRLRKRNKLVLEDQELDGFHRPAAAIGQPEQRVLRQMEREALRQALVELPGLQRQTISAAFYGQRSQRDLAETWHVPIGTIKSRVRYGLNHLRKAMERLGWTDEEGGRRDG